MQGNGRRFIAGRLKCYRVGSRCCVTPRWNLQYRYDRRRKSDEASQDIKKKSKQVLYTWGDGTNGDLGHGDAYKQPIPTKVDLDPDIDQVTNIFSGVGRAFLTATSKMYPEDIKVYAWGLIGSCFLMAVDPSTKLYYPNEIPNLSPLKIQKIVSGREHVLVLTKENSLFSWGCNKFGAIGSGSESLFERSPVRLTFFDRLPSVPVQISASQDHNAVLTLDGKVYTWGSGSDGELGHGEEEPDLRAPKQVKSLAKQKIALVRCGTHATYFVNTDGQLFSCGKGWPALALGTTTRENVWEPEPVVFNNVKNRNKVVDVYPGGLHTLAKLEDGSLWSWGSGFGGVLGHGHEADCHRPNKIEFFSDKKITMVSSGGGANLVVTKDNKMWTWGPGEYGRLGTGNEELQLSPVQIPFFSGLKSRILSISSGPFVSMALTEED